jgi:hypothetical protein
MKTNLLNTQFLIYSTVSLKQSNGTYNNSILGKPLMNKYSYEAIYSQTDEQDTFKLS